MQMWEDPSMYHNHAFLNNQVSSTAIEQFQIRNMSNNTLKSNRKIAQSDRIQVRKQEAA